MDKIMTEETCKGCKKAMDHNVRIVHAYINGEPYYSKFCKKCTRKGWESFEIISGEIMIKEDNIPPEFNEFFKNNFDDLLA